MTEQTQKSSWRRVGVGFIWVALWMASVSLVLAQERSAAEGAGSAEPKKRDFRFEIATIRPTAPPTGREYLTGPQGPAYTPGRYRQNKITLASLAWMAFSVKQDYEIEYPHWMNSTYFTLIATLPDGATKADLPIMIQHLLEDRFGLVSHHEARQMGGYQLVVAKSGARLAESTAPDASMGNQPAKKASSIEVKNGVPQFTNDAGSGHLSTRTMDIWRGRDKTMTGLAEELAEELDAPVADATGLKGKYDYTLTFTPEAKHVSGAVVSPLGAPGPAAAQDVPTAHPLLRDALQEQLGLKLQSTKNVSVEIVVLDSAKKSPAEN